MAGNNHWPAEDLSRSQLTTAGVTGLLRSRWPRIFPPLAAALAAAACSLLLREWLKATTFAEVSADALTDLVPLPLLSWAIDTFGGRAKALLFAVLLIFQIGSLLIVGAALGPRFSGKAMPIRVAALTAAATGAMLLATIALALAQGLVLAGTSWSLYTVTLLVTGLTFGGVLVFLTGEAGPAGELPVSEAHRLSRRELLRFFSGAGLMVLSSVYLSREVAGRLGGGVQRFLRGQAVPEITPTEDFYVVSKNIYDPKPVLSRWQLRVDGLADRELLLPLRDIEALPYEDEYMTLECISNEVGGQLISNALWRSVALRDVLALAGLQTQGRFIQFESDDEYIETFSIEDALDPKVRLAYQMNGGPLNFKHGAPLRVLVPGRYGMKGPKWLRRITVTDKGGLGYWGQRGWSHEARLKTMSRIDTPAHGDVVQPGLVTVRGIAFAGDRSIARVELSEDNGKTWKEATLTPPLSRFAWTHWSYIWNAVAGQATTLVVRATDGTGALQIQERRPPQPDGASGWHKVWVRVARL